MLRWCQGDAERVDLHLSPPVALFDALDASGPDQSSVPDRRHHQGTKTLREPAKRRQIAVIVVIVAEQDGRYRWKISKSHARCANPARSQEIQRTGATRGHRVGQHIAGWRLNEPC